LQRNKKKDYASPKNGAQTQFRVENYQDDSKLKAINLEDKIMSKITIVFTLRGTAQI